MDDILKNKYEKLLEYIRSLKTATVAFSGGVDSTLLLICAKQALGSKVTAITACSPVFPKEEKNEAEQLCINYDIKQLEIEFDNMSVDGFCDNTKERCYICKRALFEKIKQISNENGIHHILEGSNADDTNDYRPGMRALAELGIESPLLLSGLTKAEIRALSYELGLPTHNKPSLACLASRIPYGEIITQEKLKAIEEAEVFLRQKGFIQVRVRNHGKLARIELLPEDISKINNKALREEIYSTFKELGFDYTAVDLLGYRTGSMNETI